MVHLYRGIDYVAWKEGWANTWDIDATFANLAAQSKLDTTFTTVLSAMREDKVFNTTALLVEVWELLAVWDDESAAVKLVELKDLHMYLLEKNHSDSKDRWEMMHFIEWNFNTLLWKILSRDASFIPKENNDYCIKLWDSLISLKGFGEVFCTNFYKKLADIRGLPLDIIDLSSQSHNIKKQATKEKTFSRTLDFFRKNVWKKLISWNNIIIPGYIGGINGGIEKAIWEWYSDATAALVAITVKELLLKNKKVLLDILKSVPGIMSADPWMLEWSTQKAQVIEEMNFWIAKEIVWVRGAQAKLLNASTMFPEVIQSGVDIRLRDPKTPENAGTLISHNVESKSQGVQAVLGRRNVAMISISSFSMNEWFIAKITEVVKQYASIDIIWTSETEFAFTIDMKSWVPKRRVHKMIKKLESQYLNKFGDSIHNEFHNGLLFCIGHNMRKSWIFKKAWEALEEWNISANLVSQWLMQRALIIWVDDENDVPRWVQLLHETFSLSS